MLRAEGCFQEIRKMGDPGSLLLFVICSIFFCVGSTLLLFSIDRGGGFFSIARFILLFELFFSLGCRLLILEKREVNELVHAIVRLCPRRTCWYSELNTADQYPIQSTQN